MLSDANANHKVTHTVMITKLGNEVPFHLFPKIIQFITSVTCVFQHPATIQPTNFHATESILYLDYILLKKSLN